MGGSQSLDHNPVAQIKGVRRSNQGRTFWIERLGEIGCRDAAAPSPGELFRGGAARVLAGVQQFSDPGLYST